MARSVIATQIWEIWPAPFGMVQLVSWFVLWGDSESGHKIFIADLSPCSSQINLEHQERVGLPPLNDMNHISSGPIWWADSGSEEGIFTSDLWPLIQPFWCSNPRIMLTQSEPTCDDPYIIWAQISRRFRICSQNVKNLKHPMEFTNIATKIFTTWVGPLNSPPESPISDWKWQPLKWATSTTWVGHLNPPPESPISDWNRKFQPLKWATSTTWVGHLNPPLESPISHRKCQPLQWATSTTWVGHLNTPPESPISHQKCQPLEWAI
jgi:hypothetical protein